MIDIVEASVYTWCSSVATITFLAISIPTIYFLVTQRSFELFVPVMRPLICVGAGIGLLHAVVILVAQRLECMDSITLDCFRIDCEGLGQAHWALLLVYYHVQMLFFSHMVKNGFTAFKRQTFLAMVTVSFLFLLYVTVVGVPSYYLMDTTSLQSLSLAALGYCWFLVIGTAYPVAHLLYAQGFPLLVTAGVVSSFRPLVAALVCDTLYSALVCDNHLFVVSAASCSLVAKALVTYYSVQLLCREQNAQRLFYLYDDRVLDRSIELVSHALSSNELSESLGYFFKETFSIERRNVRLYVRHLFTNHAVFGDNVSGREAMFVERLLQGHELSHEFNEYLHAKGVLTYHDLLRDRFYAEDVPLLKAMLELMDQIEADIFVPIFHERCQIGYIIVDRNTRIGVVFDHDKQRKLKLFAQYVAKTVYTLRGSEVGDLIDDRKRLSDAFIGQERRILLYREAMQNVLQIRRSSKVALIKYADDTFTYLNYACKDFFDFDCNKYSGDLLVRELRYVAQYVIDFQVPYTLFSYDQNGNQLIISGGLQQPDRTVVIMLYYPTLVDTIKEHIHILPDDDADWEYLLYLKTTGIGRSIEKQLPGVAQELYVSKIALLKGIISQEPLFIRMEPEDVDYWLDTLHEIIGRELMHVLDSKAESSFVVMNDLFGSAHFFKENSGKTTPLLEKLDKKGVLLIKNVELLDAKIQHRLAAFIQSGKYVALDTGLEKQSDVRIICSSSYDVRLFNQDGLLIPELYEILANNAVTMFDCSLLVPFERRMLVRGFMDQLLSRSYARDLFELNEAEIEECVGAMSKSLVQVRDMVYAKIAHKIYKSSLYKKGYCDEKTAQISDSRLVAALSLGKNALRDASSITYLWNALENYTEIAALLGVSRQAVSRSCKQHDVVEK